MNVNVRTDPHLRVPPQRRRQGQWTPPAPERPRPRQGALWLLVAAAAGSLVAVGLGVYGRMHEPQFVAVNIAGFSSGVAAKAWLASIAFVLALVQLGTAVSMQRRRRPPAVRPPAWVPVVHRWSGRLAVLVTVPVAVHCLYALGFQGASPRVLVHSLVACFFYGVFVTKMLLLQRSGGPRWLVPVLGGALFTGLTVVWLSSSVWFFSTSGLTF